MATGRPPTSFILSANVSYYSVPIAWLLAFAPHIYAIGRYSYLSGTRPADINPRPSEQRPRGVAFNKTSPRTFLATVDSNPRISPDRKDELVRAEGAHLNGMENLGWFAASVVAANSAGVDPWWCNALSWGYIASRVVYNVFYVSGQRGQVRGAAYYTGIAIIIALYIKAGNSASG